MTQHLPVLASEAIGALAINPDGVYVDGTFGRGGHSRLVLEKLSDRGRLIALDRDPAAIEAGRAIADARLTLVRAPFSRLAEVLDELGVDKVDGILLDIGVSSPQLDEAGRGFSFRLEGPLDMRMDPDSGISAADWVAQAEEDEMVEVIRRYGEERFARQIAHAIAAARKISPIRTTSELAQIVAGAVRKREPGQHPATRTFQAIRIFLNRELEELEAVLPVCVQRLKPGGRLAVISFHSLEDRIVKRFMRDEERGPELPRGLPVRAADIAPGRLKRVGKAMRASGEETDMNPRARSAVLRAAERTGASG
ncbi:16S rRNA (cytosine(1402)-N(4))-methyltransferase RsmH [Betaproteobacteria bacterium SCN2]|nr:16S rRNA (cytosine(1402)-N(4))-methyltransferase RsmH [Betaproteobacteria bacterium SCN2]